jgi:acyl dehydratase
MATYSPQALLNGDEPGAWSATVPISYTQRDVLLYAVGIGCTDLRYVYEKHPQYAVFPTFPIRWGGVGLVLDKTALPPSPGPLTIDAERTIEQLAPLPREGTVQVRSRLLAVHPRGKGSAFVEAESEVLDGSGQVCVRMVSGSFRRGVAALGDIAPFEGRGTSRSAKLDVPARAPDLEVQARIADNQAQLYRLSGDYNPLHIDPGSARFGGFEAPILHGLCTYGHCGHLLLGALCGGDAARFGVLKVRFSSPVFPGDTLTVRAWHDGAGRVLFEARVQDRTVVSNAYFTYR